MSAYIEGPIPEGRPRFRFAPSPTGFAHIGSARTALYNYLLARCMGGDFILRIEDTDRTRFVPGSVEDIISCFGTLGIEWQEGPDKGGPAGPYNQSERLPSYHKWLHNLVDIGKAYPCFCSKERLDAVRKEQEAAKRPPGYDRHCRALTLEQAKSRMETEPYVIRFKMPTAGVTVVVDALRGPREFENSLLDDHVLLKRKVDGDEYAWPTYHGSSPIDDHFMGITHVVRGDEWFSSTPRHKLMFEAFGWVVPVFAHLPVILSPTGGKMSKRNTGMMTAVRDFLKAGYLPEAVVNFLLLVGWSSGSEREFYTMDEAAEVFGMEGLSKSPAAFNLEKLEWFNGMYIRRLPAQEFAERLVPYLVDDGLISASPSSEELAYVGMVAPLLQERITMLSEVPEQVDFLFGDVPEYVPESLIPKKTSKEEAVAVLKEAISIVEKTSASAFSSEPLHTALGEVAERLGLKVGQVFMPLRVALSGKTVSPGSSTDIMAVLGKEKTLSRLVAALSKLA